MFSIIIFLVLGVKAKINPHGPTVVSDYVNCVNELIDVNFAKPGLLYFVTTNNANRSVAAIRTSILKALHEKLRYAIKISAPTNIDQPVCDDNQEMGHIFGHHMDNFEAVPLADYFIGIVEEFKQFTYFVSRLTRSRHWNPSARFIFVSFNIDGSNYQNIENAEAMLLCLFKLNAINTIIVVPQHNNIRNANIYGWRPYDPPKYCGYYNESTKQRLFIENVCERGAVKYTKDVFEEKTPTNMKGCALKILALERQPFISRHPGDPNIEQLLINEAAKRYNIDLQYEILNVFRGEKQDSGQWDGALRNLASKEGHILLGGVFPDDEVHQDFECSSSYLADSYTWVVPRALQKPLWQALFVIFKKTVWMSVVASFILIALTWKILAKLSGDSTYRNNLNHYFLNTWISNLGFVAFSRPVTQSLRLFFIFLNLYCVLLLTGYQTKLIDVLTNPLFEHQIATVEELIESGLKFGGSEELHDLFENSTDPLDLNFAKEWVDVIDISKAMIDVALHRNFSLLCSRLELEYISAIVPELSDKNGNSKFYAFQTNVLTVPMEMVALRGFPFMKKFSRTLVAFKQCGVNEKVRRYFAGYLLRRKAALLNDLESEYSHREALSIQILQGGYFALIFGFVLGSIILIVENIMDTQFIKNIKIRKK